MKFEQTQVKRFHQKHGFTTNDTPTILSLDERESRIRIMEEEWEELRDGLRINSLTEIADGAADLLYTVLGTMVACGIDLHPIFQEVHSSNMTKDVMDPITKKGGKGPAFKPARVAELLLLQTPSFADADEPAPQDPAEECDRCGHRHDHHNTYYLEQVEMHCEHFDADGPCFCQGFLHAKKTCCARETRTMDGGCAACGAPSL